MFSDPSYLPNGDKYHSEYEILSEEGHDEGRRGDDLDDEEEEHVEADQDRDRQSHLEHEPFGSIRGFSFNILPTSHGNVLVLYGETFISKIAIHWIRDGFRKLIINKLIARIINLHSWEVTSSSKYI